MKKSNLSTSKNAHAFCTFFNSNFSISSFILKNSSVVLGFQPKSARKFISDSTRYHFSRYISTATSQVLLLSFFLSAQTRGGT
ncbi:MAG: hypothetical protein P1U46_02095 [Patescibacteria group bacterium]|nr:hypothetical protein [Patescibacteria group bacterium]